MDGRDDRGSLGEVLLAFLKLGLSAFGGPIAHLGYCARNSSSAANGSTRRPMPTSSRSVSSFQDLPPARSGFPWESCAAWTPWWAGGVVRIHHAIGRDHVGLCDRRRRFTGAVAEGFLHGLKLVAVAVVAQAIWGMARTLTPDRARAGIALAAVAVVVLFAGSFAQISAIALGAGAGLWLCRGDAAPVSRQLDLNFQSTRLGGGIALSAFAALLLIPPTLAAATGSQGLARFNAFYRSGAMVFGGGHVVLPLLQAQIVIPGWVGNAAFLAGYGRPRRCRGPFSFAAYLGAMMGPPRGLAGSTIALVAIFLPGLLVLAGCRSGGACGRVPPLRPPCAVPTPRWSASSLPPSTTRSGAARS